jgi:hypothetical protein
LSFKNANSYSLAKNRSLTAVRGNLLRPLPAGKRATRFGMTTEQRAGRRCEGVLHRAEMGRNMLRPYKTP